MPLSCCNKGSYPTFSGGVQSAIFMLVEVAGCPERAPALSTQKQVGDKNEN